MASEPPPARRSKPKGPHESTERRIEEIAVTLRDGTYRHGVTLPGFAKKWGFTAHRVAEISTLAAKKVRAELTDPDGAAAKGFSRLEKIAEEAMLDADKDGNNAGHRKVAIQATAEFFKLTGLAAPTTSMVAVTGDLSALTDEQLEAREREVLARIAARNAK